MSHPDATISTDIIFLRNCLLTSKGPDRMVKIADFGEINDEDHANTYDHHYHHEDNHGSALMTMMMKTTILTC